MKIGFDIVAARRRHGTDTPAPQRVPAERTDPREVTLLAAMASAASLPEQRRLAADLETLRAHRTAARRRDQALDLAGQVFAPPAYPVTSVAQSTRHTADSDWLGEVEPDDLDPGQVTQEMTAAASVWWSRVPEQVRAEPAELAVQALGAARLRAGGYGLRHAEAARAFCDQVDHLYSRTAGRRLFAYPQVPSGSSLPVGVDDDNTAYDDDSWAPDTGADQASSDRSQWTPSLGEGDAPESDSAEGVENPAAGDTHDAGPGTGAYVDYLDGTTTPPHGTQSDGTLSHRRHSAAGLPSLDNSPLVQWATRQVRAADAVLPSDRGSVTPSLAEGDEPEGDHSEPAVDPSAATGTHDADGGNGPVTDYLDGQQYPWGSTAGRKTADDAQAAPADAGAIAGIACPQCGGVGTVPGSQNPCPLCQGTGSVTQAQADSYTATLPDGAAPTTSARRTASCPRCGGEGQFPAGAMCPTCTGSGQAHPMDYSPISPAAKMAAFRRQVQAGLAQADVTGGQGR